MRLRGLHALMLGVEGDADTTGDETTHGCGLRDCEKSHLRVRHRTRDARGDGVRFRLPPGTLNKDSLRGAALPFAVVKGSDTRLQ